ncbi:MAG: site-2 protease family protein [Eubacterium sp.]|nr:site-2 protease family protein [Eubacterium sp.]
MLPVILIFVLMAVNSLMRGGFSNPADWLMSKLMILPGIIIGLSFHEFGHAIVSTRLGDPTPRQQGRVTVNPLAHIDPVGMLCLIFCGFGWGIPVQINPSYYKNRRAGEIMVGFAGVAMNLILALVFSLLVRLVVMSSDVLGTEMASVLYQVLLNVVGINVVLMVFNLLPIPPLDGFGIVDNIFNLKKYSWYGQVYQYGYFILIFMVLIGWVSAVLGPVTNWIMTLLMPLMGM